MEIKYKMDFIHQIVHLSVSNVRSDKEMCIDPRYQENVLNLTKTLNNLI